MTKKILSVVLLLIHPGLLLAQAGEKWDPFPDLPPGERVAIAPEIDSEPFESLSTCLGDFSSRANAEYYAAVVQISAANGQPDHRFADAVPYVDALYSAWQGRLDAETHILVVISLKNRAIAIHPGNRWADLGFSRGVIKSTIDFSPFPENAKRGRYATGLCGLIQDIDEMLATLDTQRTQLWKNLAFRTTTVQKRSHQAEQTIVELDIPETLRETFLTDMREVSGYLADARASQERQQFRTVLPSLTLAERALDHVELNIKNAVEAEDGIPRARRTITQWRNAPGAIDRSLDRCAAKVDRLEEAMGAGQPADMSDVRRCLEAYEREKAATERMTVFIPRFLLMLAVAATVAALWVQSGRRNRARHRLSKELSAWETQLSYATKRLQEIEERFPLYLAIGWRRWQGSSQELDQRCADAVNRFYILYRKASELHSKALDDQIKAESTHFRAAPFHRIEKTLQESVVEIRPGKEEKRRVPLAISHDKDKTTFSATGSDVLTAIMNAVPPAMKELPEAEKVIRRYQEAAQKVESDLESIQEAIDIRAASTLPTRHLTKAHNDLKQRQQRCSEQDPLASAPQLEKLVPDLTALHLQAVLGNNVIEKLRDSLTDLGHQLRRRVDQLNRKGELARDSGYQPGIRLTRAAGEGARISQLVTNGKEEEAAARLQALEKSMDQLATEITANERALEEIPSGLDAVSQETSTLRTRIPQGRETLAKIAQEHPKESFLSSADNLDELAEYLVQLDDLLPRIRDAFNEKRFLAAWADHAEAKSLLDAGNALLDEIEDVSQALAHAKERCLDLAQTLRDACPEVEKLAASQGVGIERRKTLADWQKQIANILVAAESERLNWPQIEPQLEALSDEIERERIYAEADIENARRCHEFAKEFGEFLSDLRRDVDEEQRDRPHVAASVAETERNFERWLTDLKRDHIDGRTMVLASHGIQDLGNEAYNVWTREMDIIGETLFKISQAESMLRQADRGSSGTVWKASSLAAERHWDEALQIAEQAYREAKFILSDYQQSRQSTNDVNALLGYAVGAGLYDSGSSGTSSSGTSGYGSFSGGSSYDSSSGGSNW